MADDQKQGSFTGLRRRTTPRSVHVQENIARVLIGMGGVGTIVAVLLIFVFLLWVVMPLFADAEIEKVQTLPTAQAGRAEERRIAASGLDESQLQSWVLFADGTLHVRRLSDGVLLQDTHIFGGKRPTAWAFSPDGPDVAFGFGDGTVRQGKIRFTTDFLDETAVSEEARKLRIGGSVRHQDGMIQVTPEEQFRFDRLDVALSEPAQITKSPIQLLDYSVTSAGRAFGFLSAEGVLAVSTVDERYNVMEDRTEYDVSETTLTFEAPEGRGAPDQLLLSGQGLWMLLAWNDGFFQRYDLRAQATDRAPIETGDFAPEGREVTKVMFQLGKTTVLVGDSGGDVHAWFPTRPDDAYAIDGLEMTRAHRLEGPDAAVTAIAGSRRTRLITVGYASGEIHVFHVTTNNDIAQVATDPAEPVNALSIAPKEDGIVSFGKRALERWKLDKKHPEATLASLFGPVWYEGEEAPAQVWQAESGSDDFEPKFGLWPLIFGTLKATFYSILIAAPIALLAALFTSEFMEPKARAPIKSVIEMMASLPSVVLGFLAALVIAPYVRDVLPATMAAFLTLPFVILLGARLWQLLPTNKAVELSGTPRTLAIFATFPVAIGLAAVAGPVIESMFFAGDIKGWLDGRVGSAAGGWSFILIPFAILLVIVLVNKFLGPRIADLTADWPRAKCAVFDLARYFAVILVAIGLAWVAGLAFGGFSDPRASVMGTYTPRNAMIVGFVMGFAIVPIIYTLAEDALSSVPSALREGSLGCGATQWQTAWRIVVPTAMSGLFGAMMVGLGRAVGETMIVLMAAGNTAILDLNIFNGFRTLSANIATEMPEAVKDSTHYRTLFLAGLVLFAMTFAINTAAEHVRRKVRKRSAEL